MREMVMIPDTLLVRAKVLVWNMKGQKYEKKWVQGYLAPIVISHQGPSFALITTIKDSNECMFLAGDKFAYLAKNYNEDAILFETVGQYTGVKDKNGKRIFGGDIIKCEITYEAGCYPHTETEIREVKYGAAYLLHHCDNPEVIGNIHDNPELLKKE